MTDDEYEQLVAEILALADEDPTDEDDEIAKLSQQAVDLFRTNPE